LYRDGQYFIDIYLMLFSEFIKEVSGGKIAPLYLLTGEEAFLHHHAQKALKEQILAPGAEDFDLEVLEGEEVKFDYLLNTLKSLPLISPRKLVIIRKFDELDPQILKRFPGLIPGDLSKMVLALSYEKKPDFARKGYLEDLRSRCAWINLSPPKGLEFNRVIQWMLNGRKTDSNLPAFLLDSGVELWQINSWLRQAIDFTGPEETLTLDVVRKFVDLGGSADIWSFTDAVGRKELKKAQNLLLDLLRNREKTGTLMWNLKELFRFLYCFCRIRRRGERPDKYEKTLEIHPYRMKNYWALSANFSLGEIERALSLIQSADEKLKTSAGDPEAIFLELLDVIISGRYS
jgi:DNA polymerase-3 subunit delta